MEERQKNYTFAEGYELPSKGLIYDEKVNSHVELRPMSARDEMKRTAATTTPLKQLADIIEGCMIEKPGVHVYDMAFGDYEFLLHRLRVITYGADYKMSVKCPFCGEMFDTTADLDKLTVKDFDENEFNALKVIKLPDSSKTISLKIKTPRMLEEADIKAKELKRKIKDGDMDYSAYINVCQAIGTIDGNKMKDYEIENFVDHMSAKDLRVIVIALEKLNSYVGVDNSIFLTCPKCKEDVLTFFRFGPEFFEPTNI